MLTKTKRKQIVAEILTGHAKPWAGHVSKAATLPMVTTFDRGDIDRATELLTDYVVYQEQAAAVAEVQKAIRQELNEIATKYKAEGMKYGSLVAYCYGMQTKKTLSAKLLVEAGVEVDIVKACYAESKPFPSVRVMDLSKPKKKRDDDEED